MAEDQQMINHESNILMLDPIRHVEFGKFHIILTWYRWAAEVAFLTWYRWATEVAFLTLYRWATEVASSVAHRYHVKAFDNAATAPLIHLSNDRMINFTIHGGT